jgi:hypothetical protein
MYYAALASSPGEGRMYFWRWCCLTLHHCERSDFSTEALAKAETAALAMTAANVT